MNLITPHLIPTDYNERLRRILDEAWMIFQSHFIGGRHPILKEAPFQHHFANIISAVGALYCSSREDRFFVDLEAKHQLTDSNKLYDITCSFEPTADKPKVTCAIELKFKTIRQAAQDHGRIDAYKDIQALERARQSGYDFGRFYMITDDGVYTRESKKGVGTIFCTHHGYCIESGTKIISTSKGREGIEINLEQSYTFEWQQIDKWYFLSIEI